MKLHFALSNVYLVQVGETSEIRWVAKERLQKEVDVTNGFCFGTACSWLLGQGLSPGSESSISLEYSSVPVLHTLLMNPSFWIVCPSWRGLSLVILLIMQSFPSGKCEVLYGINFHLRRAILAYVSVLEVKAAFHWKIHSRVAYCCEPRFLDSLSFMLVEEEDNINEEAVHEMNALVMVEFEAWTDPLEISESSNHIQYHSEILMSSCAPNDYDNFSTYILERQSLTSAELPHYRDVTV
ncbi:hypothetical protein LguiA_015669 [Lonicera macranthoides]